MARRTRIISHLIALGFLAAAGTAAAGTFSISPVRVELSAKQRTEALTVRNEELEREVVVQVQAQAWSQRDGQDVLTETPDIIVTPPVFTLGGGKQQIIRVATRRQPDAQHELTYRLILQEVPPQAPKTFTGLQVALRLSLPIFIGSIAQSAPNLAWSGAWQSDGSLQIFATNSGTAHAQVIDFSVQGKSGAALKNSVVKYVLPGATMSWKLDAPKDAAQLNALKQGPLLLRGASDRGEISAEFSAVGN